MSLDSRLQNSEKDKHTNSKSRHQPTKNLTWAETLALFADRKIISMGFLGLSAGIPLMLIFSSLSLWLREAGVEKSAVTYFSWAALAYSFKFLWAPLVDKLPLPWLTRRLGRRRAWLLFSQSMVIFAIVWMGSTNPQNSQFHLTVMAFAVVMLGFSSATQDTVIDAYRIEIISLELQSLMASTYIAGYRVGMIMTGAGALFLAETLGSSSQHYDYLAWQMTYYLMAGMMLIGVVTTLLLHEPTIYSKSNYHYRTDQYLRFLGLFFLALVAFVVNYNLIGGLIVEWKSQLSDVFNNPILASLLVEILRLFYCLLAALFVLYLTSKSAFYEKQLVDEALFQPVKDFFNRYSLKSALIILLLIGFYRISDIVLGVIALVFYQDMGFSKIEIAAASKTFGLLMTIFGGFLGGIFSARYGVMRMLYVGAASTMLTNLLFVWMAKSGHDLTLLYLVISADNITGGIATTAFIAYLASLVNVSFTAVQYAIFSSLMTLIPKTIGGYSGAMVSVMGYENFFLIASAMGAPVLFLIYWVNQRVKVK